MGLRQPGAWGMLACVSMSVQHRGWLLQMALVLAFPACEHYNQVVFRSLCLILVSLPLAGIIVLSHHLFCVWVTSVCSCAVFLAHYGHYSATIAATRAAAGPRLEVTLAYSIK